MKRRVALSAPVGSSAWIIALLLLPGASLTARTPGSIPWYQTGWAMILWLLTALAVFTATLRIKTRDLRRQKRLLEQLVAERSQQLREASLTDSLTGLRNRRYIQEVLSKETAAFISFKHHLLTAQDERGKTSQHERYGLFLLDIDRLRKINEAYGHDAGDRILQQLAAILAGSVRQDDVVVRMGGGEFLIVLRKTAPEYLPLFAAKLQAQLAETTFRIADAPELQLTCSIGYSGLPLYENNPDRLSLDQTLALLDLGLNRAKENGRNQAVHILAGPETPAGDDQVRQTVSSLEFALERGYLSLE